MPPDSQPAAVLEPDPPRPDPAWLLAFARMSLARFGGVLVRARRGIVDQFR